MWVRDGNRQPHEKPKSDRKSTRLNSSHGYISYAVFCLKKKKELANCTQLAHAADTRFGDANALARKSRLELLVPELILSRLQRVDRTTCLGERLCPCAP